MRYYYLFTLTLLQCVNSMLYAQEKEITYTQVDFTISLLNAPNIYEDFETKDCYQFIPNGLGSNFGYGVRYKTWATLGIHTGLDWKWREQLVAAPVFLNLGLTAGDETQISLQLGYGKGFALGRGDLSGQYKKIRIAAGEKGMLLFIEGARYDIVLHDQKYISSINVGVSANF